MAPTILARDDDDIPGGYVFENGRLIPWWYSRTGEIVKWSVFLGLITIITVFISVGYCHAKRRMRKGLAPLGYHRWLVHRQDLARVDQRYAYPQNPTYTSYHPNAYYNMQPMPPPVYDPNAPRPPVYQPPEGATKADPSQWRAEPTRRPAEGQQTGVQDADFVPPPGPPPSAMTAQRTGESNNPYRP